MAERKDIDALCPPAPALNMPHLPSARVAVLWRCWGRVPAGRLAAALDMGTAAAEAFAAEMGLPVPAAVDERWLSRGYLSIIRQCWHLLPIEGLLTLLGIDEDQLYFLLKEDDFLSHKLGNHKPAAAPSPAGPMTAEERAACRALKDAAGKVGGPGEEEAFSFVDRYAQPALPEWKQAGPCLPHCADCAAGFTALVPDEGRAPLFFDRFAARLAARWGLGEGPVQLTLRITPHGLPAESHRLIVQDSAVTLEAEDERGLLHGLHRIEREMEAAGGPYLPVGDKLYKTAVGARYIYSYMALYGDPLMDEGLDPFPPGLLDELSRSGVNGVWMQGILNKLQPFPWDGQVSEHWQQRIAAMNRLIARLKDYGMDLYLYLNEPRAMPESFFAQHPELGGQPAEGLRCLCTGTPAVANWLQDACAGLARSAPGLGGVFTITMSENLTHCRSRVPEAPDCPRCRETPPWRVVADVINRMEAGLHSVDPNIRLLTWNWAWDEDWSLQCQRALNPGVIQLCTSEQAMPIDIDGDVWPMADYTISHPGPGPLAKRLWASARARGLQTAAKVQLNNTWELSAVPFLPLAGLIDEHLQGLAAAGVDHLMLSWTLGGCPSATLARILPVVWPGGETPKVSDNGFDRAFREYPLHIGVLYNAPQQYGPGAPFYTAPTGWRATMVGFPYDDLAGWRGPFTEAGFEARWAKMDTLWRQALGQLAADDPDRAVIEAAGIHIASTLRHVRFVRLRDRLLAGDEGVKADLAALIGAEATDAARLTALWRRDARIGFEASNHYYTTPRLLIEKLVNLRAVVKILDLPGDGTN